MNNKAIAFVLALAIPVLLCGVYTVAYAITLPAIQYFPIAISGFNTIVVAWFFIRVALKGRRNNAKASEAHN